MASVDCPALVKAFGGQVITSANCCEFAGITCTVQRVTEIFKLTDVINELSPLTGLEQLVLANGLYFGNIPSSISSLSSLEVLDLSNNRIAGPLPPSIGSLSNLRVLRVSNNGLRGEIPATFGNLSRLEEFSFMNNADLQGQVPSSLKLQKCNGQETNVCSDTTCGIPRCTTSILPNPQNPSPTPATPATHLRAHPACPCPSSLASSLSFLSSSRPSCLS
ncbi:hypothetical protein BC831DRAFT_200273 [Entophlyctis helioformis]|nr:hypothetical protein BC831DRAFT_200273 [Entophlyctis helioformis]